jgi:hypothetical protein
MSKSSKTSLNNNDSRTWKPKNSIKFNSSFDEFFEERIKQQEEMAQEKPLKQEKTLRKKGSLKNNSSSYGEIDEQTTRYLQGITLRKTSKGGKRRRTRNSRKTVRRRRR